MKVILAIFIAGTLCCGRISVVPKPMEMRAIGEVSDVAITRDGILIRTDQITVLVGGISGPSKVEIGAQAYIGIGKDGQVWFTWEGTRRKYEVLTRIEVTRLP